MNPAEHPLQPVRHSIEVALRFEDLGAGTRVELEHRGWEALGERAAEAREGYRSGWPGVLADYARCCSSQQ
jgi:uncharacterized protein YndB with AHSA1/START domain